MSESDLLSREQIDSFDGLENGQDSDSMMQCDGIKRDYSESNIDDPVSIFLSLQMRNKHFFCCLTTTV